MLWWHMLRTIRSVRKMFSSLICDVDGTLDELGQDNAAPAARPAPLCRPAWHSGQPGILLIAAWQTGPFGTKSA